MKKLVYLIFFSMVGYIPYVESDVINKTTFGNLNNAAGEVLIVNNSSAHAEILGFSNDSEQSKYVNKDHVGYYIGMYSPTGQIITKRNDVIFSKNGFLLPPNYDLDKVRLGMFVKASLNKNVYSGRIISIDKKNRQVTVSGWFKEGNADKEQIPDSGSDLIINAADKIWGQNTNVFISRHSTAKTATGYELGIVSDGSHGNPVWGFHAVNISNVGSPFQQAFRVTGRWDIGFYTSSQIGTGVWLDEPQKNGVIVNNEKNKNWNGSALVLNSKFEKTNANIIKSVSQGKTNFYIKANGMKSNNIQELLNVAKNTNISIYGPSIILCKNRSMIYLHLPKNNEKGVVFEIKSVYGAPVTIISNKKRFLINKTMGTYLKIINDGNQWIDLN